MFIYSSELFCYGSRVKMQYFRFFSKNTRDEPGAFYQYAAGYVRIPE